MTNIWGFLLQTGSATLAALLILAIKEILADKLSPRWQYGVWIVLALRCLIPANPARSVLLPLGWWLETWKGTVERGLGSSFSAQYLPISAEHILPLPQSAPVSITDWLFVLYAAGVVVWSVWYLTEYIRLRRIVNRGTPVCEERQAQLLRVCEKYHLTPCPAREVPGLTTAFVCGVFRPVLALPAGEAVDDKVLLHEMLHLKYGDIGQNVFWSGLRCLHWCNPVMHWIFNRIGNDMESLCDQRVLERLEGEQRREYGKILLSMANRRYPGTPGTGSVSNGGKNIARRIEAIVRFRKYPSGMALVSVCIILMLLNPILVGTGADYDSSLWISLAPHELDSAMAAARLNRCTTPWGAADCYAKGLLMENGIYVAMASPFDCHEAIASNMEASRADGWYVNRYDPGWEVSGTFTGSSYEVLDLMPQPDGSYAGFLVFRCYGVYDDAEVIRFADETGQRCWGYTAVPVRIYQQDGWVVEETGPRLLFPQEDPTALFASDEMLPRRSASVETAAGTLTVSLRNLYTWQWHTSERFHPDYNVSYPNPNARLTGVATRFTAVLACTQAPESTMKLELLHRSGSSHGWDNLPDVDWSTGVGGGDSGGYVYQSTYADIWTGSILLDSQTDPAAGTEADFAAPQTFLYRITRDGEVIETGEVTVK